MHSFNKEYLKNSKYCGCFTCFNIFCFTDITKFVDNNETALCPKCEIDSVIGSEEPLNKEKFISYFEENLLKMFR